MIIGIWIVTIICLIVVFGEIKYHCFDVKDVEQAKKLFAREWIESVDVDMEELSMEHTDDEFVSTRALAMRGSWRLAKNQVMGMKTFSDLRAEEYCKKL